MRKIISILVALGLVLGLSVMATPVSAAVTAAKVVLANTCACCNDTYNITFNITASLTEGTHQICIQFPEGTGVPAASTFATGDITVNGVSVFAGEVTVTPIAGNGTKVCFLVPVDLTTANNTIEVLFKTGAGIVNPCTAGTYYLYVSTSRVPDSTPVKSSAYTIKPYWSTYKFVWDSSPTYPGLAPNFVPPFKACGQNSTANTTNWIYNDTTGITLNAFNLTFDEDTVGCFVACPNVTIKLALTAPTGAKVTLTDNSTFYVTLNTTDPLTLGVVTLGSTNITPVTWALWIHFDTVGNYTLCASAACDPPACPPPGCVGPSMPTKCWTIKVYQWKEAVKIPIYRKWNLISLPLVPLADPTPAQVLSAIPSWNGTMGIQSVWYFDRTGCPAPPAAIGTWKSYSPSGATNTLTSMEDGKSYWIKVAYNTTTGYTPGTLFGYLWVWGTNNTVPYSSPVSYPVCNGWNMVGYTEPVKMDNRAYLWNWVSGAGVANYGGIYGWNPTTQTWWSQTPAAGNQIWNLYQGEGYWIAFGQNGYIYPP